MNNMTRFVAACLLAAVWLTAEQARGVEFTEHLLQGDFGYAYGLAAGDLNGDGRPEISAADAEKGELSYFVYDRQTGNFTQSFIAQGETGWFERHSLGDIDGDGKLDVAVVKNQVGELLWFANPGNESQPWTRHVITTNLSRAYDVALADLNGNGRLDAAASSYLGNEFAWFENPGGGDAEWVKHALEQDVGETRTIRPADFNRDGRPDLLGASRTGNLVAWYENPVLPSTEPWQKHIVDSESIYPVHGHPVDLDGDGDQDAVMAFGMNTSAEAGQVAWYENVGNPGTGATWEKHAIGPLVSGFEAVAGDLNGDGNPDVVATAFGQYGQIAWFENPGDPTGTWTKHVLKDQWVNANSVLLVDIDGDGGLDIVAAAERGSNEVRWWHNEMTHTPEPSTAALSAAALIGFAAWRGWAHVWRKRK